MAPDSQAVFYLSNASYLEEKHLIVIEFCNNSEKRSESFKFFPSVFVRASQNTEPIIRQLVNSFDSKRFKVEKKTDSILSITARSFSDLKRFCNLLATTLKVQPLLLKPERQFLLSHNWSYFDSFNFFPGSFERLASFELPRVSFDWIGGELEKEVGSLLKKERSVGEKVLESIALSNALCTPLNELPQQRPLLAELFLEAACYRNCFALQTETNQAFSGNKFSFFNGDSREFAELDFSNIWQALFGNAFFNLSFETIDCDCCVPETAFESNILPSSMVEVRFKKNGFFFESRLENFSQQFHETRAGKESRLQRQKEFFLPSLPVGPFDSGEKAIVPIEDTVQLEKKGNAEICNAASELHWFCRQREGLLSKEFSVLNKRIVELSNAFEARRARALKQFGVFSENALFFDAQAVFLQKSMEAFSSLLESVPVHLLSPNSKFFDKQLSSAFIAIQSIILKNFKQFSNAKGAKAVAVRGNKCLLSNGQALSISKEFAQAAKLPVPSIR